MRLGGRADTGRTMAAFHFTAKIHTRAKGASAVRAAAYRAAERLEDVRAGRIEDYTRKSGVIETAILAPEGAPDWVRNRSDLWNRVEARERRIDSQLAQELELNLPRELDDAENWRLTTDFARRYLVAEGRICDIAFHKGVAGDGEAHPHIHCLMPLRQISISGFGEKHPDVDWRTFTKRRDRLEELRAVWCEFARQRAVELGIDLGPDWDHRSLAERGVDLAPQPKLGATAQRMEGEGAASDRLEEIERIRRENGTRLIARPEIVLEAVTMRQSTFTEADIARWVHRHAADDQYLEIIARVNAHMICVGKDEQGRERYSTAEMIALEARMIDGARELAGRVWHTPRPRDGRADHLDETILSDEQKDAARHLLTGGDVSCLIGYAGAGKSTLLGEVRRELEASGYTVRGATLSGICAEGLQNGSGISSRTVASLFHAWDAGRDQLQSTDVLVIDEAGMLGSRDLARLVEAAKAAKAKLILVGDPEQLQAIEAGAAFRLIAERGCGQHGPAHLTEIRRQQEDWQKEATRELATGRTSEALARYAAAGALVRTEVESEARAELVDRWHHARARAPEKSRIMLAHTRANAYDLNWLAREALKKDGLLTAERTFETVNGRREFAHGDRLLFLRNERQLEVRNGTLATVTRMGDGYMEVRTDDGRTVTFDPASYREFAHGYATTIHKAQGVTVDESFVLASRGFDRHLAYVALSRHREKLTLVHSEDSFPNDAELHRILGRERAKDTTLDYRETSPEDLRLGGGRYQLGPPQLGTPAPAPKPTQAFLDQFSPDRTKKPAGKSDDQEARRLTEIERLHQEMKDRAEQRAREVSREAERDRARVRNRGRDGPQR